MTCLNRFRSIFQKNTIYLATLWQYFASEFFLTSKIQKTARLKRNLSLSKASKSIFLGHITLWYISNYPRKLLNKGKTTRNPQKTLFKFLAGVSKTQQCNQISNECLEIFKTIITLLTLTVLFLFTFFNLILDAPRTLDFRRWLFIVGQQKIASAAHYCRWNLFMYFLTFMLSKLFKDTHFS